MKIDTGRDALVIQARAWNRIFDMMAIRPPLSTDDFELLTENELGVYIHVIRHCLSHMRLKGK